MPQEDHREVAESSPAVRLDHYEAEYEDHREVAESSPAVRLDHYEAEYHLDIAVKGHHGIVVNLGLVHVGHSEAEEKDHREVAESSPAVRVDHPKLKMRITERLLKVPLLYAWITRWFVDGAFPDWNAAPRHLASSSLAFPTVPSPS